MRFMSFGRAKACVLVLGGLFLSAGEFSLVAAQASNDITLRLGSTTGNAGDTVEVSLDLLSETILPSSLILYIAYDEASIQPDDDGFELIARDPFSGTPIVDGDGNTVASQSAVAPDPALITGNFGVDYQVHEGFGAIAISILSSAGSEIPAGRLLSIAFKIGAEVADGSMVDVMGVVEGAEILLPDGNGVTAFATSASRTNNQGEVVYVSYAYEDAAVNVGCVPAAAPAGVTATQNRSDGVLVTWSSVAAEGVEYRVYRNTANAPAAAAPLGESWQSAATFLDITARVPETIPGDGCLVPATVSEVHYFYWVRARTLETCESALSATAAEGFRTQAKLQVSPAGFPAVGGAGAVRLLAYAVLLAVFLIGRRPRRWTAPHGA